MTCNEVCPNLACKIGDDCCEGGSFEDMGKPCCAIRTTRARTWTS
jgi:hypothetical protein